MVGIVVKIVILVLSLSLFGCKWNTLQLKTQGQVSITAEQSTEARRALAEYLECEECNSGELEALVKFGQWVVPSLAATLRDGPAPAMRELYRRQLIATYQDLKKYEASHPEARVPMREEEYVKTYLDNQDALHRIRAATALATIGGDEARKSLELAQQAPYRDDVKATVKASLEKIKKR